MILSIIQDAADYLLAQSYFSNIPVVSINEKDIQNRVDEFLAKVGVGVVLGTPWLGRPNADINTGGGVVYFEGITLMATVFEAVTVNRGTGGTGKQGPDVAETVAATLHGYKPQQVAEAMYCSDGPRLQPHKTLLVYNVRLATRGGVKLTAPIIAQVVTPVISSVPSGGSSTVTISCATNYAFVWYTADGSAPAPVDAGDNPRAPYTAPFAVPTGTKVRAKAFLPGYLASPEARQVV